MERSEQTSKRELRNFHSSVSNAYINMLIFNANSETFNYTAFAYSSCVRLYVAIPRISQCLKTQDLDSIEGTIANNNYI